MHHQSNDTLVANTLTSQDNNKRQNCPPTSSTSLPSKEYGTHEPKASKHLELANLESMPDNVFFHMVQCLHPKSLYSAVKLCREAGAVSKSFWKKCHNYLTEIPLDINIVEINTQSRRKCMCLALIWVMDCESNLRSLSVCCLGNDQGVIAGVLHKCRTSQMVKLCIGNVDQSMLSDYWWL